MGHLLYCWYFKYILMLILLLAELHAELLLLTVFLHCGIATFTDLSTSSTAGCVDKWMLTQYPDISQQSSSSSDRN